MEKSWVYEEKSLIGSTPGVNPIPNFAFKYFLSLVVKLGFFLTYEINFIYHDMTKFSSKKKPHLVQRIRTQNVWPQNSFDETVYGILKM